MGSILDTDHASVRDAAFRRLLRTAAAATAGQLATDLDRSHEDVTAAVTALAARGSIRRDEHGAVIGAGGLSVQPDRHQIELDGTTFWTWCAYDILGIFAALRATGHARSSSPTSGQPLEIDFRDGRPEPSTLVLFLPDEDFAACCTNTYEQWCPNSNLFHSIEAATSWATDHGVTGTVLTLPEAAERGAHRWRPLTPNPADVTARPAPSRS